MIQEGAINRGVSAAVEQSTSPTETTELKERPFPELLDVIFKQDITFKIESLPSALQEKGAVLARLFRQEVYDLVSPQVRQKRLNASQVYFLRQLALEAFDFHLDSDTQVSPRYALDKVLVLATYLNSLGG